MIGEYESACVAIQLVVCCQLITLIDMERKFSLCYVSASGLRCNAVSQAVSAPVPIDWLESWPPVTKECIVIENRGEFATNNLTLKK